MEDCRGKGRSLSLVNRTIKNSSFLDGVHVCVLVTLSRLAAAAALEGEEVGVVTIATEAQVRPPHCITLVCAENELVLGQLHDPSPELVTVIVNVHHLCTHAHTHINTRTVLIIYTLH